MTELKRGVTIVLTGLLTLSVLAPVGAHHVGVFIPKDDDITKNFKEVKFAGRAGRFDVALKLFDDGIVHATMEKHEKRLPRGLEDGLRAALKARDLAGTELRLTVFLAFLTGERIRDAMAKLKDPDLSPELQPEHARKILNAAWRYYNLAGADAKPAKPDEGKAAVVLDRMSETIRRYIVDGAAVARAGDARKFLPRQ